MGLSRSHRQFVLALYGLLGASVLVLAQQQQHHHHRHAEPAPEPAAAASPLNATPHKPLLPLDSSDVIGLILASSGLLIAAGGGIGGGGFLVPVFVLLLRFPPKQAIPLSNVTIFGGAMANMLLYLKERHPKVDRPLVDWNLLSVMEIPTVGGALLGSFLNKILPEAVIVVFLVLLLTAMAYKTIKRGLKTFDQETKAKASGAAATPPPVKTLHPTEQTALLDSNNGHSRELDTIEADSDESVADEEDFGACETLLKCLYPCRTKPLSHRLRRRSWLREFAKAQGQAPTHDGSLNLDTSTPEYRLAEIIEKERHVPGKKVIALVAFFLVVLLLNLGKGGGGNSPLGIKCGSAAFWGITAGTLVWVFIGSVVAQQSMIRSWRQKEEVNYQYPTGDVHWDPRNARLYPAICLTAGVIAGLTGLGGGIVKGPLMLEMGILPQVASATSACMILFTSFTATTSYIAFGLLRIDYAIPLFFVGLLATGIGHVIIERLVKRYKRVSLIILSIGAVIAISAVLLGAESTIEMIAAHKAGASAHAKGGICATED